MSITFRPVEGTTVSYTYYKADPEDNHQSLKNGCIRFAQDEPSCNACNSNALGILDILGFKPDYIGTIPNCYLVALETQLTYACPQSIERYRDQLLDVVRCAMYHNCDVVWS